MDIIIEGVPQESNQSNPPAFNGSYSITGNLLTNGQIANSGNRSEAQQQQASQVFKPRDIALRKQDITSVCLQHDRCISNFLSMTDVHINPYHHVSTSYPRSMKIGTASGLQCMHVSRQVFALLVVIIASLNRNI